MLFRSIDARRNGELALLKLGACYRKLAAQIPSDTEERETQKAFYIETAEEYEKEAEAWKLPVM